MKKEATKKTQVCLLGVHLKRHYVFRNTNTNEIARRLIDAFFDVRTVTCRIVVMSNIILMCNPFVFRLSWPGKALRFLLGCICNHSSFVRARFECSMFV
jgi:hypothetical protein